MTTAHKHRAVLKYGSKHNFALILMLAKAIYAKMSASATFVSALALLATLDTLTTAFSKAQDAVNNRIPKASGVRNAARDKLLTNLKELLTLVQGLADAATPEEAVVIIEAAGMTVAAIPTHSKPILSANLGVLAGVVLLVANARLLNKSKRSKSYGWEYTLDGGKTWISAPSTGVAHTSISGLPPLTMCGFRVNVTDMLSVSEWTQVVSILVH